MNISLRISSSGMAIRELELSAGHYLLGSENCEIELQYPTVSRRHGKLLIGPDGVTYVDCGSRNGSYLLPGKEALPSDTEIHWPQNRELRIGPFRLSWRMRSLQPACSESVIRGFAERYSVLLAESPGQAKDRLIHEIENRFGSRELAQTDRILEKIHSEFHGNGPLEDLLSDQRCREVIVNAFNEIYADVGQGLEKLDRSFLNDESYRAWAVRKAHDAGRRLDLQQPICEATLEGGARFHAVIPPISARGLSVSVRRFGAAPVTEEQALETGWLEPAALVLIQQGIRNKKNIVISGGTSTGKTSLLNFLCRYLDPRERIVTVEDTVELAPPVENLIQLQARGANADGAGQVSLRQLVQCALRMRPDRIIVGECRGSEVLEMLQALNTGHPGSLTTVHANSAEEALHRLELLALLGAPNLSIECIRQWIHSSVDLIIQVTRESSGHRCVDAISGREHGTFRPLYRKMETPPPDVHAESKPKAAASPPTAAESGRGSLALWLAAQ